MLEQSEEAVLAAGDAEVAQRLLAQRLRPGQGQAQQERDAVGQRRR